MTYNKNHPKGDFFRQKIFIAQSLSISCSVNIFILFYSAFSESALLYASSTASLIILRVSVTIG